MRKNWRKRSKQQDRYEGGHGTENSSAPNPYDGRSKREKGKHSKPRQREGAQVLVAVTEDLISDLHPIATSSRVACAIQERQESDRDVSERWLFRVNGVDASV